MKIIKELLKKLLSDSLLEEYYCYKDRIGKEKKYNALLKTTQLHYKEIEKSIKSRSSEIPLRFASYVVFDSTFCAYGIMEYLIKHSSRFSTKIVIIPDISRGEIHMREQYKQTRDFFCKKYGENYILDGFDLETGKFFDYSENFDVIYRANPYDSMVNNVHSIQYLSTKNVLPIYMSYGCHVDRYSCYTVLPLLEMSLFWKVFADNKISYRDFKKYELIHGKNVVLTGYSKMDELAKYQNKTDSRKTVIIAPHHTINMESLPLSNFLNYSELILELPKKYPDIQFIFRPHPLLFTNMVKEGYWSTEKVNQYLDELQKLGVIYSYGGDYLEIFAKSDAIIHDCASFIVEYLYTDKPCCFFAKKNYKKVLSKLGIQCLKNYYLAFNEQQIFNFMDKIVLGNEDPLSSKRQKFVKRQISINYPNVSECIINKIESLLF